MTLREVLDGAGVRTDLPKEPGQAPVDGLDYDSRRVGKNFLFFAFQGQQHDGRRFAGEAIGRGALAVVSELPKPEGFAGAWIEVEHGRRALAVAARNFYGKPDEHLRLTGITGTNGKSTTTHLVDSVLRAAGKTTALLGTIEYLRAGRILPSQNTTPESLDILRILAELNQEGGTHATLEVSSHGLALGRVYGIHFHTAVFTNLTRDHLDFHPGMEEYFAAKRLLFEGAGAPPPRFAAINHDDPYGRQIRPAPETKPFWYGLGSESSVRAEQISATLEGLRFELHYGRIRFQVSSPLLGRINVYNILAACSAALSLEIDPETIARGIFECPIVPGRLERVEEGQPFLVLVDYAHTDDALRNVIVAARSLSGQRVLTLFGCGGDRDRAKRPLMGEAAGELSDFVVLTSDNPRSEDPLVIMNDALVGLRRYDVPHIVEPDREKAIRLAIEAARPGDIVIIAGKGHETYQALKDRTIPFDDRDVARKALHSFGYGRAGE